jgi:hypothetical protein
MRAVTRHAAVTNYASTAEPSITPTLFGVSLKAAPVPKAEPTPKKVYAALGV